MANELSAAREAANGSEGAARIGIGTIAAGVEESAAQASARSLARFARLLHNERRLRDGWIDSRLLSEPGWDILLDLFASEAEGVQVNVSSACIAADVPSTTALRYVATMVELGLVERRPAFDDHRVSYVLLSDEGRRRMSALLMKIQRARQMAHFKSET